MENILSDYAGFDSLNALKRQFKEKRCRNVCVSYEKNENYKPKPKKWKVKLPNGDIESFDNKRDAEVFASVMMCHLSLDSEL